MLKRNKLDFEGNFVQIPNSWMRDERLSYKARGVLAILMTHSPGWKQSQKQLETVIDGREAIRSAVKELTDLGYLVKEQKRSKTRGTYEGNDWILAEPSAENPHTDNPHTENPLTKNTNSKEEQLEEVIVAQSETEQRFSEFWDSYPHRQGDHKKPAKTAFCRLTIKNQKEAIAGAKLYASHPDVPPKGSQDRRFIPMAATWLRQERWNEIEETQKPVTKEVKPRWASS